MAEIKNRFGELLERKKRRDGRSYTRRELEDELGISRTSIDNILNNQSQRYDMRIVGIIIEWLDVDITEFFVQEDDDSKELGALLPASA